jgi:hypothetical protein
MVRWFLPPLFDEAPTAAAIGDAAVFAALTPAGDDGVVGEVPELLHPGTMNDESPRRTGKNRNRLNMMISSGPRCEQSARHRSSQARARQWPFFNEMGSADLRRVRAIYVERFSRGG